MLNILVARVETGFVCLAASAVLGALSAMEADE